MNVLADIIFRFQMEFRKKYLETNAMFFREIKYLYVNKSDTNTEDGDCVL